MKNNLVVGLLGHSNSGKSSIWYELFGEKVKTGKYERRLYLSSYEYIEVFLVGGSPEERGVYVGDIIGNQKPRIVLCSMQYYEGVSETINFFSANDYFLNITWLNPGYIDKNEIAYRDYLGLADKVLSQESILSIRNAKYETSTIVREIQDYLYGWAKSRDLIKTV